MKRYAVGCLLSVGLMSSGALLAQGSAFSASRIDYSVSAGFTLVRANFAPGKCDCFSMYGGSAQGAATLPSHFSLLADVGATRVKNASGTGRDLALSTYQAGARYSRAYRFRYKPYAQVLFGVAHLDSNFVIDSGSTRPAYSGGIGLDYRYAKRFDLRVLEVMYLDTPFDNGSNNRQNQIRLTSGLVFHIFNPKY